MRRIGVKQSALRSLSLLGWSLCSPSPHFSFLENSRKNKFDLISHLVFKFGVFALAKWRTFHKWISSLNARLFSCSHFSWLECVSPNVGTEIHVPDEESLYCTVGLTQRKASAKATPCWLSSWLSWGTWRGSRGRKKKKSLLTASSLSMSLSSSSQRSPPPLTLLLSLSICQWRDKTPLSWRLNRDYPGVSGEGATGAEMPHYRCSKR